MFLPLFLSVLLCKRSAVRLSRRRVRLLCLCTQFNHVRVPEHLTRRLLADILFQRVKRARQRLNVDRIRIFIHMSQTADLLTLCKMLRANIADVNPIISGTGICRAGSSSMDASDSTAITVTSFPYEYSAETPINSVPPNGRTVFHHKLL